MSRPGEEDQYLAEFGKRVAFLRQERGLTQDQLAVKTKLTVDTIGAIERGKRWGRLTTLHRLAKGFSMTIDELFKGLK
jgi:transcriptional regulator with XRE-family HTH domain